MARIIIVDDEPVILEILNEIFSDIYGHKVQTFKNPLEFEKKYSPGMSDLFILDVDMPYRSGVELAKEIRSTGDNTPIVFHTASPPEEAKDIYNSTILTKPSSIEDFDKVLKKYLG